MCVDISGGDKDCKGTTANIKVNIIVYIFSEDGTVIQELFQTTALIENEVAVYAHIVRF